MVRRFSLVSSCALAFALLVGMTAAQAALFSDWSSVSAGGNHTCAIRTGQLYCWGGDWIGQVGNGDASGDPVSSPQRVGTDSDWTSVSAGEYHTCGIRVGQLYCWGDDYYGQVGDGDAHTGYATSPVRVGSFSDWKRVSAGYTHTCGIRAHQLFCWGHDDGGQVGNGDASNSNVTSPTSVSAETDWKQIAAGATHTCATRGTGLLFCWGDDTAGEVGNGDAETGFVTSPQQIGARTDWSAISAGYVHSCGLRVGKLYCWGNDYYGGVGNGDSVAANVTHPQRIGSRTDWTRATAGEGHTCGIRASKIFCWGEDIYSQVGNGDAGVGNVTHPQRIGVAVDWKQISAGFSHTCGIRAGELSCWGRDNYGQVGNGDDFGADVAAPQRI